MLPDECSRKEYNEEKELATESLIAIAGKKSGGIVLAKPSRP